MRVLVVGGGGREHALVWKIKQSPKVKEIFCAPGNAGTSEIAENIPIAVDDIEGLLKFALNKEIGLTVVGPEQPLVMGIVDQFELTAGTYVTIVIDANLSTDTVEFEIVIISTILIGIFSFFEISNNSS